TPNVRRAETLFRYIRGWGSQPPVSRTFHELFPSLLYHRHNREYTANELVYYLGRQGKDLYEFRLDHVYHSDSLDGDHEIPGALPAAAPARGGPRPAVAPARPSRPRLGSGRLDPMDARRPARDDPRAPAEPAPGARPALRADGHRGARPGPRGRRDDAHARTGQRARGRPPPGRSVAARRAARDA